MTGCSTGIGRATAQRLAKAGHVVLRHCAPRGVRRGLRELGARTLRSMSPTKRPCRQRWSASSPNRAPSARW
ncbi:hypothetical protein H7I76_22290 [Mycolicibacterium vaccae]|nr:hypothetical protein [Mycolicibacterium vaccae]